jgi:hypothetical protein
MAGTTSASVKNLYTQRIATKKMRIKRTKPTKRAK